MSFLRSGALLAELPVCQSSKRKLLVLHRLLTLGRNRAGCSETPPISRNGTRGSGTRHGHLVCFQKNLLSQPHIEIQVRILDTSSDPNLVIKLFAISRGFLLLYFFFEEGISLLVLEDIAVSDVTLLHVLLPRRSFPFEFWKWGQWLLPLLSKATSGFLIIAEKYSRGKCCAAEHLISAFPG